MSFRIPVSINEADGYTTVPLHHLYNPFVNTLWRNPGIAQRHDGSYQWTVKQHLHILKALYSKENILAAPSMLLRMSCSEPQNFKDVAKVITEVIPEDKLWVAAFIYFQFNRSSCSFLYCKIADGRTERDATTWWYTSLEEKITLCMPVFTYATIPTDVTFRERLITLVNDTADYWTTIFESSGEKFFYESYNFVEVDAVCTMINYMKNRRVLYNLMNGDKDSPFTAYRDAIRNCGGDETAAKESWSCGVTAAVSPSFFDWHRLSNFNVVRTKAQLATVFSYNTSPTNMLKWPLQLKNEHKPVLYGVELEVSTDHSMKQIVDAMNELFLIGKQDSSISGVKSNRIELVTVPCSLRVHKREWAHLFSKLDYEKFDTSKDTNNGMHVHIDRTAFADKAHIRNLAWLVNNPGNVPFWIAISERTESSWHNYSPNCSFGTRSKVSAFKVATDAARTVRGAVNVGTNKPTVEVRLFRGIVSYAGVLKNLECVDAMFHYTMSRNIKELTARGFVSWVRSTPVNKYPVFKKFLDGMGNTLTKLLATSDIKEITFNTKDPTKIVEIIDKTKFKLTNDHVTALNKGMRKRTFVLNKKTGKLEVVFTNRSPLAHMDRELEKRFASMSS